jgi:predicted acyl esterase
LPFTAPVVSVGVPIAHLYLSHTNGASDLIFFAKVWDVAPDGSATLIKRLIAPVRVPNQALGRPVNIELLGFAHLFPKGHAVRLTLAATDATSDVGAAMNVPDTITVSYGQPNPAPATTPDQQLAMYAPKDYSWFSLPMLSPRGAELYTEPGTVPGN